MESNVEKSKEVQKKQKKIQKCDYGYLNAKWKKQLLLTVILFGLSVGTLLLGIHITGDKKNLLTLVAVLGMLPASKEAIGLIMFLRAKKYACPKQLHDFITEMHGAEEKLWIRYDLYMTAYQNNFPIYAMACKDNSLIGYTDVKGFEFEKAKEHISLLLTQNGFKNVTVKIFSEEKKFLERLEDWNKAEGELSKREAEILHLMENLSL